MKQKGREKFNTESEKIGENSTLKKGNKEILEETDKDEEVLKKEKKKKIKLGDKIFIGVTSSIIVLLLVYVILFSFFFMHVEVVGTSMNPTLNDGDILVVNKVGEVNRGDVIIVSKLKGEEDWLVKRVIAIEGDEVVIEHGKVYVNGEILLEDYLLEPNSTYAPNCTDEEDIYKQTYHVGENEVFFLGDNRKDSKDGRFYGACSVDNVEGVVSPFFVSIKDTTTSINRFTMKIKGFFGIDIYGRN